MSRPPVRSCLAGLALAALALALACQQPQTGGFVCKANGREQVEQEAVYWAMECAYDKVDFKFCRNEKCLVEVTASTECDLPDFRECVIRHILAANGLVVERETDATLRLTSTIEQVKFAKQEHYAAPNVAVGEVRGTLAAAELGPGGVTRTHKLLGYSRKGY
jgi:hypothetical protein